ncbi:molybdopterin-dependent oxidoreductase [Mobilicoccus pelagius]|uniref:Putative oxidoreductase n=1 Tax=Mobilicoccus pelagius NBRC 104925 TaxID=1089455 RepID=H5UPR8_9MICO|nr:molybdopterin-dependent oxidoreductase [Mobilicoccus pelagius]GAB47723.1 putative oxidoreductase [Mobilicoccus pelagius NBRC 104925]
MEFGFPVWLRVEHFLNLVFVSFLIRSGIEILGTYPKLYRSQHTVPGTAWAQFTVQSQAKHKYYTVGGEYDDYSPRLSMPGKGMLGLGRYWHFMTVTFFVITWVAYLVLLFGTGQWRRYIPTDLGVVAQAGRDMIAYLAFTVPHAPEGLPFNAIQQLSYAGVVFVLTPLVILTGAFQSPAIANHFSRLNRAMGGRQVIRSLHFLCLVAYLVFVVIHVAMVLLHGWGHETSKMVFGHSDSPVTGGVIFAVALALLVVAHVAATRWSLRDGRAVERVHNVIVRPWSNLLYRLPARMHYDRDNVTGTDVGLKNATQNFRGSGRPPETDEYLALMANCYVDDYALEIGGYVERPMTLTVPQLRELAQGHSQTTLHHCVQGFSSIGKWRGIPVSALLELAGPLPGATDVVYVSFQNMGRDDALYEGGLYYESNPMIEALHPQTLVAFELNDEGEIAAKNGAPVRLRVETSTGFRSIKWLERIEVVNRYDIIGQGRGGYFEDVDFFDRNQLI